MSVLEPFVQSALQALSVISIAAGIGFFIAGSVGMLRLPDTLTRLHALTKADNLGIGLVALGVAFQSEHLSDVLQIALVWLLALYASSSAGFLFARLAHRMGDGAGLARKDDDAH